MNYIPVETFLKQTEKVQRVLKEWWKPKFGDKICCTLDNTNFILMDYSNDYKIIIADKNQRVIISKNDLIPILQLNQIIDFVEEITKGKVSIDYDSKNNIYDIWLEVEKTRFFNTKENDLLQSLWQVAIKLAEEMEE